MRILGPTDGKAFIVWKTPKNALSQAVAQLIKLNRVNISGQVRCRSAGTPPELPIFHAPFTFRPPRAPPIRAFIFGPPARQHLFAGRRPKGVVDEAAARTHRQAAEGQGGVGQEILLPTRGFRRRGRAPHLGESGFLEGAATCCTKRGVGPCVLMRDACVCGYVLRAG